jgi:hypothetical protein
MAEVIKTDKLIELLEKYKIKVPRSLVSQYAQKYGIEKADKLEVIRRDKRSPNYTRKELITSGIYKKPSDKELKEIKKQYDINRLKASGTTEEGAKAFELRYNKVKKLLKEGISPEEVKKIMLDESGFRMSTSVTKAIKELKEEGLEIKKFQGKILKIKDDLNKLNKSEVKDLIRSGETNVSKLITKSQKILNITPELAARRLGQLIESFAGDNRYINAKSKLLMNKSKPLTEGLGKVTDTKLYGGIGGGLQRMMAEKKVSSSINKPSTFFSSLRKRIQELIPSKTYEVDEIKNIASSGRSGTGPYSIFLQGIKSNINQEKASTLDKQMSIFEKRIQETENVEEKKEIAKRYNTQARKFAADANKNLKPGQLPVRVLEFSFDEPNKVIKNKSALEKYGELFDDIYKKYGYSFKVPSDVKTIDEIIPYLQNTKGNVKTLKALAQKAPRIFGIPITAYLGYKALNPSAAEAKILSPIQDTQTAMQDQQLDNVYANALMSDVPYATQPQTSPVTEVADAKLADDLEYDDVRKVFVIKNNPEVKATQSDILYWLADNEIPEEVVEIGKMVGQAGAVLGGATVALGLPDVKKTIEERKAIGKSPITGALAKGFYRLGSPFATAAFTAPQILDEEITTKDILTDPLNYLGLATMETFGKKAGTIAAPAAAEAAGLGSFLKNYTSLKNVGEAVPGRFNTLLRLGLSPRTIAGAARFLGIPGLIASGAYTLYDYLYNKESE